MGSIETAVLFANEAFYRAFADKDLEAMAELWATDAPVVCIHPGWDPLVGYEAVLASWRAILRSSNAPDIRCRAAKAFVYGDAATVVCYEQIGNAFLVATNTFIARGPTWRIVHHQAGPAATPPKEDNDPPPPTMN